nr:PREDICTED: nucleolar protein 9 [Bemisia tabaci]
MSGKGVKRKKKHGSFVSKMKKYHRKGSVGRGNHIEEETYLYFLRMYEAQKKGFDSEDDKSAFVNNFLEEIKDHEIEYSKNQIGSRLIEALLPDAAPENLKTFAEAFMESLRPICCDEFASHVLEALLRTASSRSKLVQNANDKEEPDMQIWDEYFQNLVSKISKFMLNNLEDFVWDKFANHVLRTVFISLVGGVDARSLKASCQATNQKSESILNVEHKMILKDFAKRLMMWPQLGDLPFEELTSGLLQILLLALHKSASKSTLKSILNALVDSYMKSSTNELLFANDTKEFESEKKMSFVEIPSVFEYEPAVHLFEVMITVAPHKLYTQMFAKFCMNRIAALAMNKKTNFIIQKLLLSCQESAEFESIFTELEPHLASIFQIGHSGVILSLCQTGQRLTVKQGQILQNLQKILNCYDPKDRQMLFVPLLVSLKTYEVYQEEKEEDKPLITNMHGCLILQAMLAFNKPAQIINSMLSMTQKDLLALFCDSKGCHIAEAFLRSPTVGAKSRERLFKILKDSYAALSSSKYGSWVFEALWEVVDTKQKISLMEELILNASVLESTEFGSIISSKVSLQTFRKNREAWIQAQSRDSKKKKLFEDIL